MTTATQVRKVASAISGIESRVADTMVQVAADIASTCREVFGGLEPAKDVLAAIVNTVAETASWSGTKSEDARKSELRAVIKAYPDIGVAAKCFRKEYGELRREHFIKLARMLPGQETPQLAAWNCAAWFEDRADNKGSGGGKAATLGMGLGIIKNVQSKARNVIAFRKELAILCTKHGITY